MTTNPNLLPSAAKRSAIRNLPRDLKKLAALVLTISLIADSIVVLQTFFRADSEYTDGVVAQLQQEMTENRFELSRSVGRRTVAEFKDPILLTHGKESRLIVYTSNLNQIVSISSEGWGGWDWVSAYQDIDYTGQAQYTVDLSQLSDEDFTINNELKTLTVRIPYAELSPINIPASQIRFRDVKRGWAAPKDIKLTPEQTAQLEIQVENTMKAKLIDDDILSAANQSAKTEVANLLSTTVRSIDPEFTVVVVQ